MEAIEEPPAPISSNDNSKNNVGTTETSVDCVEADVCHKSNGVVDVYEPGPADEGNVITETVIIQESDVIVEETTEETVIAENMPAQEHSIIETNANDIVMEEAVPPTKIDEPDTEMDVDSLDRTVYQEIVVHSDEPVDENSITAITNDRKSPLIVNNQMTTVVVVNNEQSSSNDQVRFKTEILIEKSDVNENNLNDANSDEQSANNILNELGQGIELSEALRSSDVTDNIENNNCSGRQEVFNKEELLDILQGKDVESPSIQAVDIAEVSSIKSKALEAHLALEQLKRLTKKKRSFERIPKQQKKSEKKDEKKEEKKGDSIVNVLVKDWDDEESETDKSTKLIIDTTNSLSKASDELKEVQLAITCKDELIRTSIDSAASEEQSQKCKSGDEDKPQRRLGRIIKKKVIFDPDNPDTFTKGKSIAKNKEVNHEKESPTKKIKSEITVLRSKSKSPINKLQWKKPSPKNAKQNKRLSEVDKLLMDEGAVNMIYQLTPEAPKGKKNVKTKAEFIKKLQSSTPEGKEMKFRGRKKDSSKYEDEEAKKILGGKHRVSLSSSVKSPSVCEDFETHSADDSIIYRRHSSSSYSSTCMSPRRLSDVESNSAQSNPRSSQTSDKVSKCNEGVISTESARAFMPDSINLSHTEMINRDDCLSIKEKLKSKLSLALNKRKRESSKSEKAPKQKKVKDVEATSTKNHNEFKYLTITIEQRLAEINVIKAPRYNVQTLKEVEQALEYVDGLQDISITLLTSQCGTLCSSLDLRPLLNGDEKRRAVNAFEIAEGVRSLLSTLEQHRKLLCTGVWGACWGLSLALVARSDVALASERATFAAASPRQGLLFPGLGTITSARAALPQSMINDLIVFGRRISASEALQAGLLTRCLWPERFTEQLRNIVREIAAQPLQNVLLKKQLLGIRKNNDSESTFLSYLEIERDLLVDYWTSVEAQELLRAEQEPA